MKKIHETLYILHKCNRNIQNVWDACQKHQQEGINPLNHFTYNLAYYLILEAVSFLDEYEKEFTVGKQEMGMKRRVEDILTIVKPIKQRIEKFWDITPFRNNIIAHRWRKGHVFVVPQDQNYRVPRSWFEYQMLKDLINYIYEIISREFMTEMDEALTYAENLKQNVRPQFDFEIANAEIKKMAFEIENQSKRMGKNYQLKIYTYENESKEQFDK